MKLSPKALLALFCCMNMLVYIDRGVIASNGVNGAASTATNPGSGIQGEFGLTLTQDGFLPAAFMVGLLIASPVFAELSHRYNGFRLIAVGLGIWTLSTAGCGLAPGFIPLVLCRMLVGVGEASFVSLASPFIDDNAPPAAKTRWLALFYLCIPVGFALGYILGGVLAGPLGWRGPFLLEAAAMVGFVIFCGFGPAVDLKGAIEKHADGDVEEAGASKTRARSVLGSFGRDLATLARHPVYIFTAVGSTIYTGVFGAYSYLGPKAGRDTFNISGETADLTFGVITVVTGVVGTLMGGILLDRMGSSVPNALLICGSCTLIGCIAIAISFGLASTLPIFVGPFALGEIALFAIQAPSNAVALWSVPPGLRPFGMSILIVVIHVFGDVPSPSAVGWLQDKLHNWRLSMAICTFVLVVSSTAFFIARHGSKNQPDYRELASAEEESAVHAADPLLSEGEAEQDRGDAAIPQA